MLYWDKPETIYFLYTSTLSEVLHFIKIPLKFLYFVFIFLIFHFYCRRILFKIYFYVYKEKSFLVLKLEKIHFSLMLTYCTSMFVVFVFLWKFLRIIYKFPLKGKSDLYGLIILRQCRCS